MAASYLLALDQGTTSSRAIIFDSGGKIVAMAQEEFAQHFPAPAWIEHDAEEIWATQSRVAVEVLAKANLTPADVAGLGITNQRETSVIWDRATGKPVANAIVWQDRRTAERCEELKAEGWEPLIREKTGLLIDPYFSATKIGWILDHTPGVRERAERGELAFGTIDSWLIWNLTGQHLTDVSNAARTLLYNIHTRQWDDELLALFGVPRALLPEVRPSATPGKPFGITRFEPLKGIPVAGVAGDQSCALFGQTAFTPGTIKCTYGTGCFLLMNTGARPIISGNRLLTTVAWQIGEAMEYALEGSVFVGGAVIQWLRDGLGIIQRSRDVQPLAASVPNSGGVIFVPAFAGLGAPVWDPKARGAIFGLTRGTTSAHIARAAVESIAFQCHDVIQAMMRDAEQEGVQLGELKVDGGAAADDALLQFQADLVQAPVIRPKAIETTAMGAAWLAGLAVGLWQSRKELTALNAIDKRFLPAQPIEAVQAHLARWAEGVRRSCQWATS